MKILLLFYLFTLSITAYTVEESCKSKIVYFTLPKGGSQLFRKTITLMTERPLRKLYPFYDNPIPSFLDPLDPTIGFHHLEPGYDAILKDPSNSFTKIIMIRDPRDVIVSMLYWIEVMAYTDSAKAFTKLPIEEQMAHLILDPDLSMSGSYPFVFDTHLGIQCALEWMKDPTVFVCRFENLVGPLGGGSYEQQIETLVNLAKHLNLSLSSEKIIEIANTLFGDTFTFRAGQIGSWKELFTPSIKEIFKTKMGQELIDLGYEKDNNW